MKAGREDGQSQEGLSYDEISDVDAAKITGLLKLQDAPEMFY